jgi:uncharacterized protein YxeA
MKRAKYVLLLLIVFILFVVGIFITNNRNSIKQNDQVKNTTDSVKVNNVTKDTIPSQNSHVHDSVLVGNGVKNMIPSNWKAYDKNALGVTFKYPDTWAKNGEESNAINRNGEVMSISINLVDTISNSNFYLAYHLAPYGAEVYKLAEEDYNSSKNSNERDAKQITVSGYNAIETFTTMSKDIKGNIYDPPLKLIHIVFLDNQKTGGYNLNFITPAPGSEKEIAKFNQLLSTFKFINKPTSKTN